MPLTRVRSRVTKNRGNQGHPLPALQNRQGNKHDANPQDDLSEVVRVAGARPQARSNELTFVIGVGIEAAFLIISYYFHRKSENPHQEADQGKQIQLFTVGRGDRYQRSCHRQCNPQALDSPYVQETDKRRFDLIETIILARFFNATEQEGTQPDCPDHNQHPHQDRSAIHTSAQKQGQRADGDISEAACQVEELLGLPPVSRDKDQPLDEKGQADQQGKDRDPCNLAATLAAGSRHQQADQDQNRENDERITIGCFQEITPCPFSNPNPGLRE